MELWSAAYVEAIGIARAGAENRSATIGIINDEIYVAIWTKRRGRIRLITVRRARKNEEKIYREKI